MELSRGRTIFMAVTVASAYCVWGLLISLQPPFYPAEAERKGATPSQYGFVFGIANLAAFLFAPLFGRFGTKIGPKLLYNCGAYLQAICGIAFGFLTYIDNVNVFIGLSYLLRALGGIADVAAWGAVLAILLKVFPEKYASILSWTETFFGLGYMLGPALGALLYDLGGFTLPFLVVGSVGFVVATSLVFSMPTVKAEVREATKTLTLTDIAKSPSMLIPFLDLLVCFFGNGLFTSMLSPHLEEAGANASQVGLTFLIFGGVFMLSTPTAGYICDKARYPTSVSVLGNMILATAFIFLGPLPTIQSIVPSWQSITTAAAFVGLGYGAVIVSTFGRAQGAALRMGFSQNIETHLLISGMWTTSFYFGNFLGPTLAGFLVDAYGFRMASVVFFSFFIFILLVDIAELAYNIKTKRYKGSEAYDQLE